MSIADFMRRWLTVQPASVPIARYDVPSGERVESEDVLALSAAYACVRLIAGTEGSLPVRVLKGGGEDGAKVEARDHWAYRLLHESPNGEQSPYEFFEEMGASLELKGNALAIKEMAGDGRVTALTPIRWDETRVSRDSAGVRRYEWRGETFGEDGVLHIPGFGSDAQRLGGLSTIAVAGSVFGLAKAVNRAAGSTFRNGIRSQIALVAERDLTPEQMDTLTERLQEKYQGAVNSGRPLILNNGLKAETLTINPEDAQLLESRGFSVEEVCRFFGVPPFMVGHTEKTTSWGSGVEQAVLGFQKFTMTPRLKRIEQALKKQLLTAEDRARGIHIEFNVEGLLRGDSKGRAEFYRTMTQIGAMTINEVRAKEGLAPVTGGDVPRLQAQNVAITEANDNTVN